jgi:hypothetical protein
MTKWERAYFAHLPQGNFLSQARFSLLHSIQLCCGFIAVGDAGGEDEVADMLMLALAVVSLGGGCRSKSIVNRRRSYKVGGPWTC